MTRFVALMVLCLTGATAPALADCGDSENPMSSTEGFGVAQCRTYAPRYDARAVPAPRHYASAEDPMVWSDDQWRTSLFDYNETSNGAYDRRERQAAPQHMDVEIEPPAAVESGAEPVQAVKPRGPKLMDARSRREITARPGVLQFEGHKCNGVLVLTVGEAGTIARCKVGRRFQMLRGG